MIARIAVDVPPAPYEVLVGQGLLERAGAHLHPLLSRPRVAVVTDEAVAALHLPALRPGPAVQGLPGRGRSLRGVRPGTGEERQR